MPTLEELQKLDDGQFHRLCDDLFRLLQKRYSRLRTHGLNSEGISIKGQPDSYVGEAASTCSIAFQYSVDKGDWWNKIIDDVRSAVATSPDVREIIVATPRNIDRDGPKDKTLDWLAKAKTEAANAVLQPPYDGRDIARLLDSDHQDLRFEHLGIPYSRLCGQSILASCQRATEEVIVELVASGRLDPARYTPRHADRELFEWWQMALRPRIQTGFSNREPTRLIPLVNDAGVGKTSLLSVFARSVGSVLPAVLLQARDMAFVSEDCLVTYVIHALQGVLEAGARLQEEAAITHHLAADTPLTVVLDGLDEARDAQSVRKALSYWLKSKLGQRSVLFISSRPEFWKMCFDRAWSRWIPKQRRNDHDIAFEPMPPSADPANLMEGIRLPNKFTESELEDAWKQAGRKMEQFFALPAESRSELRHPFTLRVYLNLLSANNAPPELITRAKLLETWLNSRLDAETDQAERLTTSLFQEALIVIATHLSELGAGSLAVDRLVGIGIPRFDAAHPPGLVVERLIAANILESVTNNPDRIRFAVETVQDFYQSEAELKAIVESPVQAAGRFHKLRFTEAYTRLARVGQLLVNQEARHIFVESLANIDICFAAIVINSDPTRYSQPLRQKIVEQLGRQIESRFRVRGAFAIQLLSRLKCKESCQCLAARIVSLPQSHVSIRTVGAIAFAKLGCIAGVGLVFEWPWFGFPGDDAYYFSDILSIMRGARKEFKAELAEYALRRLGAASGHREHIRAVTVLAYLGDDRLAPHLSDRLTENDSLLEYENHALIAIGTTQAGRVFFRSAIGTAGNLSQLGFENGGRARYHLRSQVYSPSGDYHYLATPEFGPFLVELANDENQDAASIGIDMAMQSRRPSLIRQAILTQTRRNWSRSNETVRGAIPPDAWICWWKEAADSEIRRTLLDYLPIIPNAEIEQILIDRLASPDLRGQAAPHLGGYGCYRAAPYIRQLLQENTGELNPWESGQIADALGLLRDRASVVHLRALAIVNRGDAALFAVHNLGFIATPEADDALCSLLGTNVDEQDVAGALICCGSPSAVSKAVDMAKSRSGGAQWLCECLRRAFWTRGYQRGQFYTHIATAALTDFLASKYTEVENKWDLIHAFEQIDSEEIRVLLRRWAGLRGTQADSVVRDNDQLQMSVLCFDELLKRGDEYAIDYYLEYRSDQDNFAYARLAVDNLSHFPQEIVAAKLRNRLAGSKDELSLTRFLSLLGQFGSNSDAELIQPFVEHPADLVANVACEAFLRLTDPLLVPEKWREL